LVAATILALPIAAKAQPISGLYVGAGAGVNIMQDENIKAVDGIKTSGLNLETNVGAVGVGSVGYGFGNGFRAEMEFDYRYNGLNKVTGDGGAGHIGGSEQKYGPMVNVLYDFNGLTPWFVPYLGVGAGYQWANENGVALTSFTGPSSLALQNTSKGSFAYQGIVGAAFPMPAIPGLAFTAEYRYMGLAGSRTYGAVATVGAASRFGSVSMKNDHNNTILLGIRYNFGVAPPPPPAPAPVPAAAPARSYLVFFDWDKYNLTDRARQIIAEAAANSTKVQYTRIEVNGYTDTSGTPKYNLGLSIRRANAVKAELIKDGVPANAITTQGFGDTHLLVPTGPGVREPQNRRVEIIIR
jgi:outer membrane protein OmpA-like peptidoglycan-associated protein